MTWQEKLQARRAAAPYRVGETVIATAGDFAGTTLRLGRVYDDVITLEILRDGVWVDFCTERVDIVRRFTRRSVGV